MHVWTRLALIESNFNEQRRKIASTEGYLIHPKDIYKSVRTIEGTEHLKFATKTIYSANTALLLQFLLQTKYGQNRISTQQLLDELDEVFPEMFVGGAAANISEETYEMAFWIRCCLLIEVIRERRDTIPAILAVELFCSVEPPKRKKECKELLLQGPYAPLGGLVIENMKDVAVRHTQNLEKICGEVLAHKARADIITSLGNVYPLEDLWNELTQWAHETYKKLHEGPKDAEEENKNLAAVAAPTRLNQNHRQAQKASEVSSRVAVQAATKHQIDKQQSQEQEYEQHSEERQIADQLTVQKHGDEQMEMGDSDDQDDLFVDKERSDPESEVDEPIVRTGRWGLVYPICCIRHHSKKVDTDIGLGEVISMGVPAW